MGDEINATRVSVTAGAINRLGMAADTAAIGTSQRSLVVRQVIYQQKPVYRRMAGRTARCPAWSDVYEAASLWLERLCREPLEQ